MEVSFSKKKKIFTNQSKILSTKYMDFFNRRGRENDFWVLNYTEK